MSFQVGDRVICLMGKAIPRRSNLLIGQECTITKCYKADGETFVNILGYEQVSLYAHRFQLLPQDGTSAITRKIRVMEQRFKERKENGYHLAA